MDTIEYKGYIGKIIQREDDSNLFVKVEGIKGLAMTEAQDRQGLDVAFRELIDDYIKTFLQHQKLYYKGYTGSVEYSDEDGCFYGEIDGISDLVTYESKDHAGLEAAFQSMVDDYIESCQIVGKEPETGKASEG